MSPKKREPKARKPAGEEIAEAIQSLPPEGGTADVRVHELAPAAPASPKRNEAGDRLDGGKDVHPVAPPPPPRPAVPVITEQGRNEAGDVMAPAPKGDRNEAGDRIDGAPNPPPPPPPPPPPRGLPPGAIGFNQSGDPIFPKDAAAAEAPVGTTSFPVAHEEPEVCPECMGAKRVKYVDRWKMPQFMVCQKCMGYGQLRGQ